MQTKNEYKETDIKYGVNEITSFNGIGKKPSCTLINYETIELIERRLNI